MRRLLTVVLVLAVMPVMSGCNDSPAAEALMEYLSRTYIQPAIDKHAVAFEAAMSADGWMVGHDIRRMTFAEIPDFLRDGLRNARAVVRGVDTAAAPDAPELRTLREAGRLP